MKEGLRLASVRFAYDENADILKGIDAYVAPGSFYGIIGPNGAGKTTLLRIISGYLKPQAGAVTIDGKDITGLSIRETARLMALVPQFSGMEYDFTVQDIVLTGRHPHLSRLKVESISDYDIANSAMQRAGISHLKHRSVLSLSGGEWQRMIIARAICQQSDFILLDEPVSHLDIRHQVDLLHAVRSLVKGQGITAIAVLHDLSLTYNYCDSVMLLKDGAVYASGRPEEVLTVQNIETVYGLSVHSARIGGNTYILPKLQV